MKQPIKIICEYLNKSINISPDAVENIEFGWICDCGYWTKLTPNRHIILYRA